MKKKTAGAYTRGRTVQEHIAEQMKDYEFKKAWHDLDSEFELLDSMLKAREKAGLTQEELAKDRNKAACSFQGLKEAVSKSIRGDIKKDCRCSRCKACYKASA